MRCWLPRTFAVVLLAAAPAVRAQEAREQPQYPNLRIGGFSDLGFFASNEKVPGPTSGFKEGQFVLHFTSQLSPTFNFFGELSVTPRADEFKIEVERTILRYDHRDWLKVSFGRYHTPINWWNTAFHHGQWLQTTVDRPEMTRFGGRFIPVHFVGTLLEGRVPFDGLNLSYEAGVGNGRGAITSRAGDAGDVNNNRAWLAGLSVRPDRFYALQVGGAFYRDLVPFGAGGTEWRESIASAHVVWMRESPEFLSEFAWTKHERRSTGLSHDGTAFYVQLAYRLPAFGSRLKPYARFEKIDVDFGDPFFTNVLPSQKNIIGGLRCDASYHVALKGEYRRQQIGRADEIDALYTQISYAF